MAAPTETYIDPASGAANGNDHGGTGFVDGSFANATLTLTKIGAFPIGTCRADDKLYLDDNGSGEVTPGLYTISARTDDNNVVLTADIRSGGNDPTDVRCDNHTGAIGLPWATVQHALKFVTRDAANGDRFNVKAGADDVLVSASLDFSTYGTPTALVPWICQGFTAAAGDGGIGGISGAGSFSIVDGDALDYLAFFDMHLHNSGVADVFSIDNSNTFVNCEIDNTTGYGLDLDNTCTVLNCHIHNCDGVKVLASSRVIFCTIESGASPIVTGIHLSGTGSAALFNVINMTTGTGIALGGQGQFAAGNSIYSTAGTGVGINAAASAQMVTITSNIVEGFSGIGGDGIVLAAGAILALYGHNAFYSNTTNLTDNSDAILIDLTANDINPLNASAFIDAANDDFRIKPTVQALGYPEDDYPSLAVRSYMDMGALQRKSQMLVHLGMSGGARG